MAVLPIYIYEQSILRKKAKLVKGPDAHLGVLTADMLETMHLANGIGLAANQIGSLQRIIVVDVSDTEDGKGIPALAMINPEIVVEEGSLAMEEGCLSIPDIREEVERPEHVTVKFRDVNFNEQKVDASGLLARVIQHEIDHLNGILFFDRIGAIKRKLMRGRLNRLRRGEFEVNYPVVAEAPERLRAEAR